MRIFPMFIIGMVIDAFGWGVGGRCWVSCRIQGAGLSRPRMRQSPHWAGLVVESWCRGNLKQVGIYLFFLVNNLLVNLLGIPAGMLCDLGFDGRWLLNSAKRLIKVIAVEPRHFVKLRADTDLVIQHQIDQAFTVDQYKPFDR